MHQWIEQLLPSPLDTRHINNAGRKFQSPTSWPIITLNHSHHADGSGHVVYATPQVGKSRHKRHDDRQHSLLFTAKERMEVIICGKMACGQLNWLWVFHLECPRLNDNTIPPHRTFAEIKLPYENENIATGTNEWEVLCLFSQAEEVAREMSAMWVWERMLMSFFFLLFKLMKTGVMRFSAAAGTCT